jgi:hypothetical protein
MRQVFFAAVAVLGLALAATTAAQDKAISHAYYPLKVGSHWTYAAGKDRVVIQVEKEMPIEFVTGGKLEKVVGFSLKGSGGPNAPTEQVAVLPDGVYRFTTAGKSLKPPLCILKFRVNDGDTWPVESKTEDGKTIRGEFVAGADTITLMTGGKQVMLKTLTATSKGMNIDGEPMSQKYWFAEGLGMVKQHVTIGKHDITLELREYKPAP